MPSVEFRNVGKDYARGVHAVDGVDFTVANGELLVLVGPSGCGKSTLLRMIAGLEEITRGEIKIGDRVVNELPPKDRDIAMVFQNYALYPHMTVRDNMAFGLRRRKMPAPEADRRVAETAKMLGLERHLDRRPRELSGGERQRVALGRAMVRQPQVFLFDEPLSNLDAKLRVHMRTEIKRLHQQVKTTMIYVTHDQVEAMTLGDRIAVLDHGKLQQIADPFTLYSKPANRFVAGFIGSPAINFFRATVSQDGAALEAPPARIDVTDTLRARLAALSGREVTVGVRPEDLSLTQVTPGGAIPGTVVVREPLGNEVLVHWDTPVGPLVSRITGQTAPAEGERATLHFAAPKVHVFDNDTEAALDGVS
jgi:multiple sugar transport system ATP-binding protein